MNTNGFDFDQNTRDVLEALCKRGSLPHAVIIESADAQKAAQAAQWLSMYAVCTADDKPCGECAGCHKAQSKTHPDINYPKTTNKSNTYDIDAMRSLIADAYIIPNEANAKVYIFEQADARFTDITQNAFLKLLEEPPRNVFFILICQSALSLLITIRSRCTVLRLKGSIQPEEAALTPAREIVNGILSPREYELMLALRVLSDKKQAEAVLAAVKLLLRDATALLCGAEPIADRELAAKLAARFTKQKLIEMAQLCDSAAGTIKQNVNINLLTTWLCGEFRRISWQR